jgi:hypothetical protein
MQTVSVDPLPTSLAIPGWCPEDDTRDNVVARRNVLMALWAGRLIGLSGPALTAYAVQVHLADFQASGDHDVADKVTADLHRAGVPARPSQVRMRLNAFHREALIQTCVTD